MTELLTAELEKRALPMTPGDRRAAGKRLRDRVPRDVHAVWREAAYTRDPIGILRAADATRQPELVPFSSSRVPNVPTARARGADA